MRRKKYFDWEEAFRFIWENADRDGIWHGDAVSLAAEFDVSEETAGEVLDELRGRQLIEKLHTGSFYLSNWREKWPVVPDRSLLTDSNTC
jgi:DNA-binding FadR family transcriptional regulator